MERTGRGAVRRRVALGAAGAVAVALVAACGSSGPGDHDAAPAPGPSTTAASGGSGTVPATAPASPGSATAPTKAAPRSPATPKSPARPQGYDPSRDAAADIAAARRAAAGDGHPVLIDFGADWCPDCVVLGRTFTEPDTAGLLAEYHVVRVDVGQFDHNLDVAARYVDLGSSGIPALAVLDAHGHLKVATNQGQFSNARSMPASAVNAFLTKWS